MTLYTDTITDSMGKVAKTIFRHFDPDYYLAGGTALALQIGHRKSIDLDYFISKDIDTAKLRTQVEASFSEGTLEIVFEEKNTLWCVIDGIKVSFISRFDSLAKPIDTIEHFRLASIEDITTMKLSAICGREEYKDYFDLACIMQKADSRLFLTHWTKTYPHVDPTSWLVALATVNEIPKIPLDVTAQFLALDVEKTINTGLADITKYLASIQ